MHRATGEISFVLKSITSPLEIYSPHFSFPASPHRLHLNRFRFQHSIHLAGGCPMREKGDKPKPEPKWAKGVPG